MHSNIKAEDFLKDCQLKVWNANYSVLQVKAIPSSFVAIIKDHKEISVVAASGTIPAECIIQEEKGWKIISFETVLPFELVGFLAMVAKVLAEEQISIFALSAYSTDHIMVKESMLDKALSKPKELGCVLQS